MSIYEDMKARLTLAANAVEGSFALDNLAAVAVELDKLEQLGINYMPNRFFPTLAWGDDLTLAAQNFGIERKEAVSAYVWLVITGEVGAQINSDVKVCAGELVFACTHSAVIGQSGVTQVQAMCETPGSVGNVPVGAINEFITSYAGLISVSNVSAGTGGLDVESDAELISRVQTRWQNPSTGGNITDYLRWAMEVNGISGAHITNPSGGNVDVYVVGAGNVQASEELVAQVYEHIEGLRPVGAHVQVFAATPYYIDVEAALRMEVDYEVSAIKPLLMAMFAQYISEVSFTQNHLSYLKFAELLFVTGVKDVVSYTINGENLSITIPEGRFAALGEVNVTHVD